jgi:hypothetical protein
MKNLFLILAVLITISSCNTTKLTNSWVAKHCNESHIFSPTTGKYQVKVQCDSLYNNANLKEKVNVAIVVMDVRNAYLSAEIESGDSSLNITDLIKLIQFKK